MTEVNWPERYHASAITTLRVRVIDRPGSLATVLSAIARAGTPVGDICTVGADGSTKTRDVQVFCMDKAHVDATVAEVESIDGATIEQVIDDVLEIHRGGAIETQSRVALDTLMALRMVYTPGVASVCKRIHAEPGAAWDYTARANKIAIVTNGTAVLGLGDIGALAGLPVMEGKAAILAHFVGVSAEPVLINSKDAGEIINIVEKTASQYGAIQLEDIAAPACFEIESALQERLDIPVFHDDQHGTATVCVAGLIRALEMTSRDPGDCRAAVLGAGAAGLAIAKFLVDLGIDDVVLCDSRGAVHESRDDLNPWKAAVARETNRNQETGQIEDVIKGRNLFIGVSRPGLVTPEMVRSMSPDPIVFALANPVSEIGVDEARRAGAAVAVDGRGMNNALAYPGIFRGALDARAPTITHAMKLAAARALASAATGETLLPDMLNHDVHRAVSQAVREAAGT